MKNAVTLDHAIDTALHLPADQIEMLIDILHHRQIDAKRKEISEDARQAITLFRLGQFSSKCAADIISELHEELENDE